MTEELLAEAGPDLLDRLVATARTGQAGDDPAAGRFIASCLVALATASASDDPEAAAIADRAVARHLVARPDTDVRCEVHLIQTGGAAEREHAADLAPADALLRAAHAAGTDDLGIEVLATAAGEPAVLALLARPGGPLEYAFPAIGRATDPSDDRTVAYAPPPVAAITGIEPDQLVEALRSAMGEVAVQVDFGEVASVAERVADKLAESFRVPSAHDVADVIAPLIPTPGDVADIVSERVAEHLPAIPATSARAALEASRLAGPTSVNVTHLELELATLHDQLQATHRSFTSMADELGVTGRRAREQQEALSANLSDEMHRLSRRVDERVQELAASKAAPAGPSATERELRSTIAALDAAIERLEAAVRRTDRSSDARTLARLTRTVQVLATHMGAKDVLASTADSADPDDPEADRARTDHPLRLIDRRPSEGSAAG
jgi:hypothetical protein